MVLVSDIWPEVKKIMGSCDESILYRRLTDAVEILANKGDFDPMIGFVDICTDPTQRIITLPREVETILGLNHAGTPWIGRDRLFTFHINGPGDDCQTCDESWQDMGDAYTFREIECPSKLFAQAVLEDDEGAELWVYGFDEFGQPIRTEVDGEFVDGFPVPVVFNSPAPGADAPTFARITRVRKAVTKGSIRLSSIDNSTGTGSLLGVFAWDETFPVYRRIKLSRPAPWVRIAFRRRTFKLRSQEDWIPLSNSQAVVMMLRALKYYDDVDFATAGSCEATAMRWLEEEQFTRTPPVMNPIQVGDPTLGDETDEVN